MPSAFAAAVLLYRVCSSALTMASRSMSSRWSPKPPPSVVPAFEPEAAIDPPGGGLSWISPARISPLVRQGDRALQNVFELAHIAGKRVGLERRQGVLGEHRRRDFHAPPEPAQDRLGELLHVLRPLAQRGYAQFDDVDPVEQVLAEFPFGYQLGEILVGGRQNAHIDADSLLARRPDARLSPG